ncbi:MAG: 50S ribosomal protein L15 [Phycisphaeraceae bacterium]
MMIHEVTEKTGRYKKRKRVGRGIASGHGKTCGRGQKGAGARSGFGGSVRASREGGSNPFFRRIPKVGFSNFKFRVEYVAVNVGDLDGFFEDGAEINPEMLVKVGLLHRAKTAVKILGGGETKKKFNVTAAAFSKSAIEKIEKAGGKTTVAE